MKDPTTYLKELGVELDAMLNPRAKAQVDDAYLSRVNYEMYYFDTPAMKDRFDSDPRKQCGFVTDPITKKRFRPTGTTPFAEFKGRPWFFLSDSTRTLFAAMPDSFLSPRYSMKPKATSG